MVHHDLITNHKPEKSTRVELLQNSAELGPEKFSVYLQKEFNMPGKRMLPQKLNDDRWRFRFFHPGHNYDAVVSAAGDSVEITYTKQYTRGILVGFHRLHGYGGGWLYNVWAFLYDLSCIATILFPVTGIFMWYKLTKKHALGWIFLTISFGFAAATILYLVYAP